MGTGLYLPRLAVLWLLTACCYGLQVMAERQRQAQEEAREFEVRERQLRSAGRLAAEIAHQIKNPLAIINNAVFSLQRALNEGRKDVAGQIGIIREEVERSDRIVTQIMGYAQLSEGRLERLAVADELDSAIGQVFPPGAGYPIRVQRRYEQPLPPLLMQRRHFSEILVNVLQNARDALAGGGDVSVTARCREDLSVEIVIADTGPGIPPDKLERVFEAYVRPGRRAPDWAWPLSNTTWTCMVALRGSNPPLDKARVLSYYYLRKRWSAWQNRREPSGWRHYDNAGA